jgi:small subunit ribosomal protein S6
MRRYETVVLLNPELSSEQVNEALERYQQLIGANAGTMLKLDDWGQRPLAYPVKKFSRSHYSLLDYCGESRTVSELERNIRIDERCLKFMTVMVAESADPVALQEQLRQEAEARAAEAAARAAAEAAQREAAAQAAAQAAEAAAPEAAPEAAPVATDEPSQES